MLDILAPLPDCGAGMRNAFHSASQQSDMVETWCAAPLPNSCESAAQQQLSAHETILMEKTQLSLSSMVLVLP